MSNLTVVSLLMHMILTEGQTLSYRTVSNLIRGGITNSARSSIVDDEIMTIYGIPVGLNVVSSTSTSTYADVTTRSTGAASEVVTMTATASASPAQNSSSSRGGNASVVGVAVGASIGVVAGSMLLTAGVCILWRKRRTDLKNAALSAAQDMNTPLSSYGQAPKSLKGFPTFSKYA